MDPFKKEELKVVNPQIDEILNEATKVESGDDMIDELSNTARIVLDYQSDNQKKEEYINHIDGLVTSDDDKATYDFENEGPILSRKKGYTVFSILISTITVALGIIIAIIMVK